MNLSLVQQVDNNNMIHWWVDANFLVHTDSKIRTKIFIRMRKGSVIDMPNTKKRTLGAQLRQSWSVYMTL